MHVGLLQKPNEEIRGLTADPVRQTYWVYTNQSIFELRVDNESRDVWKIYLEQGQYDVALRYAKVSRWSVEPIRAQRLILPNNRRQDRGTTSYLLRRTHSSTKANIFQLHKPTLKIQSHSKKSRSNSSTSANAMPFGHTSSLAWRGRGKRI